MFYQYLKCVYQVLTTLFSDFTEQCQSSSEMIKLAS